MIALAVALALASAPDAQTLSVDPAASAIRFHLRHKLHPMDGRTSAIEGKAVVAADGKVMTMVRVPVSTFDSGDANRDANMRETLEASRHPFVVLKGVTRVDLPVANGRAVPVTLRGELDFHGVKQPIEVPTSVEFAADGSARVTAKLKVSLEAYRIERPSLLFLKVDDDCEIDVDLKLRREPS
jgi:polyisoprenoid-binding protein YceI